MKDGGAGEGAVKLRHFCSKLLASRKYVVKGKNKISPHL
jgi:hypothetical protein